MSEYRNPIPTADAIIAREDGAIVLIQRKNPPLGWAIPGGYVEYGEELSKACVREAREETSLEVEPVAQLFTYSDPRRDPLGYQRPKQATARGGTKQQTEHARRDTQHPHRVHQVQRSEHEVEEVNGGECDQR